MHQLAESVFDRQVTASIACYRERRDRMRAALDRHMPEGVTWTSPEGGIFLWLTLPEGFDGAELLARAVAEEKLAFVPGRAFFADGTGANTLRLSFSLANPEQIETGIAALARLIRG